MIKRSIYPKTQRIENEKVMITEKLDGSNLGFFKLNGELYIATRNWIYTLEDALGEHKGRMFKGLAGWLNDHGEHLKASLGDKAVIFGEWIGMGKISYGNALAKRFYIFAKANIDENFDIFNLYYYLSLFHYSFKEQEIPDYMDTVKVVCEVENYPSVALLDEIYNDYVEQEGRMVEGFIINQDNSIRKYVRNKNGYIEEHKHKGLFVKEETK